MGRKRKWDGENLVNYLKAKSNNQWVGEKNGKERKW